MNALVMDADPSRVREFKSRFVEHGWQAVIVGSADSCLWRLGRQPFDYVFLDDDLGVEGADLSDSNAGAAVARWLQDNEHPNRASRFVLHGFNDEMSEYMHACIFGSVRVPGVWFEDDFSLILEPGCTFWGGTERR